MEKCGISDIHNKNLIDNQTILINRISFTQTQAIIIQIFIIIDKLGFRITIALTISDKEFMSIHNWD